MARKRVAIRKHNREHFLEQLRQHGNVTRAAQSIGRSRDTLYIYRDAHPEFKALWESAVESFVDGLETEAARRAAVGVLRPVYQGGKKVGEVTEYSDRLLEFLLDRRRYPAKSKHEHTGKDGAPMEVREIRDVIVDPATDAAAGN
jgi:hypothetical protein